MIYTRFKIDSEFSLQPLPDFCRNNCFNFFKAVSGEAEFKKIIDNIIELKLTNTSYIEKLKLTNCFIVEWSDLWHKTITTTIDPMIRSINLSANLLTRFEAIEKRDWLRSINLSSNTELSSLIVPGVTKLRSLYLNNITKLEQIEIGKDQPPELVLVEFKNSVVRKDIISQLPLNPKQVGILDLTGATVDLSTDDKNKIKYLESECKWKVIQSN